ncbi:hypothetical protein P171DRAFT_437671 [Karstenula rhodostoma CBS 690.94]|uniref:Uncharacterized protein n=1 Tax=Karstenula rhodostoma CBS 690.94 TaxID=1392251 RepID=A0A9P4P5D1_9PLEO|nr:hypothetical protein P171DRAFT_437671 [Karstenula rhodostoma CBS 690.94]
MAHHLTGLGPSILLCSSRSVYQEHDGPLDDDDDDVLTQASLSQVHHIFCAGSKSSNATYLASHPSCTVLPLVTTQIERPTE